MPTCPRVLVVDDVEYVATTTSMILNASGFESVAVFSGAQALDLARIRRFDILLTDVIMTPMNGIELAGELLKMQPGVQVVLISGTVEAARALDPAHRYGEFPLLQKPIAPRKLIEQLRARSPHMPRAGDDGF